MILPLRRVCYLNLAAFLPRKKANVTKFSPRCYLGSGGRATWPMVGVLPEIACLCYLERGGCVTRVSPMVLPRRNFVAFQNIFAPFSAPRPPSF